jgi:hypothetical protein
LIDTASSYIDSRRQQPAGNRRYPKEIEVKPIKMFSLAALAAVAAMAIAGAPSASAKFSTTICLKSELVCADAKLVCADANRVPVNSELHLLATTPKLSTSLGTITCEKSDAKIKT